MPQKKKRTSSGNRKKNTTSNKRAAASVKKTPKRREIGALICLILGFLTCIGYFHNDGWFINVFCGFARGLVGWGFYILPPVLIICAVILGFHKGRPVVLRVTCTLLLTVLGGAIYQLFISKGTYEFAGKWLALLWKDGRAMICGGVFSGILTILFKNLFSKVGAAIVFICCSIFFLMEMLNQTPSGLWERYKNRERLEYDVQPEPENKPVKERVVKSAAPETFKKKQRTVIDIPIDGQQSENTSELEKESEKPFPKKKKGSFFNKTPRVTTPDQFVNNGFSAENSEDVSDTSAEEIGIGDYELFSFEKPSVQKDASDLTDHPSEAEKKLNTADQVATDTEAKSEQPSFYVETIRSQSASKVVPSKISASVKKSEPETSVNKKAQKDSAYLYPPISLLSQDSSGGRVDGHEEVKINKERLEKTLRSFGINANISNIIRGPSVTRYEMELEVGVKLNRLTNLSDDIALALGASGVRIAAIPNKISTVGIEVPNKIISKVLLRDIIDSSAFKNATSKLTFAIGKNISGDAIVGNIAKLPHMLVAGTTGSGKSVCLNSLILSIMYKATPDEVKFIMVDPKMVEFKIYNGIPHLLVPVVTEAKKAAGALQWAVTEMMKRYRLFSETGARDLKSYNKILEENDDTEEENIKPLPQIVVVIDELADLMMVAAKEVEESVCRIAQMGRAAGVHLVIATQSPRADVITGLMKANIPSRIALKVSSSLESRIILDAGGNADKLVGNGDMLYAPIGTPKPIRIQGTWVSDEERESIIDFVKKSGTVEYSEEVMNHIEKASAEKNDSGKGNAKQDVQNEYDELLPDAVDVIFESGQASVSMLQRRLKLGYSRAARIIDQMEEAGIVGPFEGSKPRQLLITKTQWQEMQFIHGTAPIEKPLIGDTPTQTMFSADDLFED